MAKAPFADNPLRTRSDAQRAARSLVAPLEAHASPGGALVVPGRTGARFTTREAGIEGFARPLWAIAALSAGGGAFDGWDRYRTGLINGTGPDHPEYWGTLADGRQKVVEASAVGTALALAPGELWDPLNGAQRERVADWLRLANGADLPDNNWLFFRVLANAGLRAVGADHDWDRTRADLDRLEDFYLGDGWYADGPDAPRDYYCGWVMHVDALLYAAIAGDDDPERADRFRERAIAFADQFRYWFEPDGRALPYGRSLVYRFAQASFWSALALVDGDAPLPWGEIRGLWRRNLRWWANRPIAAADGTLTLGYAYPTLKVTEPYNSPSSPYWAALAFLALAAPAEHPFWTAEEAPSPDLEGDHTLDHANQIVRRDGDHVVALTGGRDAGYGNKYAAYAYSTRFGFGVDAGGRGLETRGVDSALVLREGGDRWRSRAEIDASTVADGLAYSRWRPWDDVVGETWLVPFGPWHLRVHRLRTDRALETAEGGFALGTTDERFAGDVTEREGDGAASVAGDGFSGVRSLAIGGSTDALARSGDVVRPVPNTNVLHPRTAVPTLRGEHAPGEDWVATAVLGDPHATGVPDAWEVPPRLELDRGERSIRVRPADGPTNDGPETDERGVLERSLEAVRP